MLLLGVNSDFTRNDFSIRSEELSLLSSKQKSDIWSVGMILLEMALGMELLGDSRTKLSSTLRKVMSWVHAQGSAVDRIVQDAEALEQWKVGIVPYISIAINFKIFQFKLQSVKPVLKEVIESCLQVLPQNRPSAEELLHYRLFHPTSSNIGAMFKFPSSPLPPDLIRIQQLLSKRPLAEVFYLWQLAGGDIEAELRKTGILRNKPQIFSLPRYIHYSINSCSNAVFNALFSLGSC